MHSKNPMDIYNRIVGPVNCNKADTSVVEFKIYKRNIQQFTIKALALKVNKMICKTKYYFFGSKNEGYFITSSKIDVTKFILIIDAGNSDTRKLWTPMNCQSLLYVNINGPLRIFTQFKNAYFPQGVVTTAHEGRMTSNLGNTLNCEYTAGFCITHDNVGILYKPDPTEQDDFVHEYATALKWALI